MESLLAPLTQFKTQFSYSPSINYYQEYSYTSVVICGMGGSAISVNLLKQLFPELPITLHNSYGIPSSIDKASTFFILNSYSGNTEEVLESYDRATKEGLMLAVLSKGGELIKKAEHDGVPYIQIPDSNLEPRFSIGYQMLAILAFLNEEKKRTHLIEKIELINEEKVRALGKQLAEHFSSTYPVLYSSSLLYPVAYLIKAAINEGAKLPCFLNVLPEANHNELQSFIIDDKPDTNFAFLYLISSYDHIRIQKRFTVMQSLYEGHNFIQASLTEDHTDITGVFELVLAGYYMATFLAEKRGCDPYKTPTIAAFKNTMNS